MSDNVETEEVVSEDREEKIMILAARCKVYEILARAFRYPWNENYFNPDEMLEPLNILLEDETIGEGAQGLIGSMKDELSALNKENLQMEYVKVFGHGFSMECPPYEAMYGIDGYTQQIYILFELGEIYRRYGVDLSDTVDERMDHISIELEFMQYLTYKEAYGIKHGHKEEALEVARNGQREFITAHLGRWAPLFCQFLSQKAGKGLYKHLAEIVSLFLISEVRLLGVRPKVVEAPEFHPIPTPYEAYKNDSVDPDKPCFVAGDDAVKEITKS